mgnify:CR=1 FL=1
MKNQAKKFVSVFALTTLVLVSLFGVCKVMATTCGLNCSTQEISAMHLNERIDACAQNVSACAGLAKDHITTFVSVFPAISPNALPLLLVACFAFFVAWHRKSKYEQFGYERLRTKLRSLKWRLTNSVLPDFLILAFSRGILNSKIYA